MNMGAKRRQNYGFTDDEMYILKLRWGMMERSGFAVEFDSFDAFVQYCKGKFGYGLAMERIDTSKGWCPENIRWADSKKEEISLTHMRKQALRWEAMMGPIRRKYANELANIESSKCQFFRYEHPDLVREGIVFDPSR